MRVRLAEQACAPGDSGFGLGLFLPATPPEAADVTPVVVTGTNFHSTTLLSLTTDKVAK